MKVIVTCGGTGGHIMPALAIADLIKANEKSADILFVGAKGGMEEELVSAAGYEIRTLAVKGLVRSFSADNIKALYLLRVAEREARHIVTDFRPDLVLGTGGYACYPTLAAAARLGVPTAVHESNAVPGVAVRRLSRRVDRVWLGFAAAGECLPSAANTLLVGNPPRNASYSGASPIRKPTDARVTVLSFGGSLGAREMNRAVLDLMEYECARGDVYHVHGTGKREYEEVLSEFQKRGLKSERFRLLPFIEDMPRQMAGADIVISRAGAMSVSEIAAFRRAAILIPSPNVVGDHQYKNAKLLADAGGAILLEEKDLGKGALTAAVKRLIDSPAERAQLAQAVAPFGTPDAGRLIYRDILSLVEQGKRKIGHSF